MDGSGNAADCWKISASGFFEAWDCHDATIPRTKIRSTRQICHVGFLDRPLHFCEFNRDPMARCNRYYSARGREYYELRCPIFALWRSQSGGIDIIQVVLLVAGGLLITYVSLDSVQEVQVQLPDFVN